MSIRLSIVTVTFNSEKFIEQFLDSVNEFIPPKTEVIVFDNDSKDNTVPLIKKKYKFVKLITNEKNLGFAKGNNLASKKAKGEYILFLNPDTKLVNASIKKLMVFARDNPQAGIVAPKLIQSDGTVQPSVRKLPGIIGVFKEYYLNYKNAYNQYCPFGEKPLEVESVYGAAMLIKTDTFWKIGGFDENYFLYYEDLDLCKKMNKYGKKIYYLPEVKIIHKVGGSIVSSVNLPPVIKTLAFFIPIRGSGKLYYLVESANYYHGVIKNFLISLLIFMAIKTGIHKTPDTV